MKPIFAYALWVYLLTIPLTLVGCNGTDGNAGGPGTPSGEVGGSGGGGGGGGGGGSTAPIVASVDLVSSADTIGLSEEAGLTATVVDANGVPMEGVTVTFTLSGDVADAKITSTDVTDADGHATAILKPGSTPGDVTIVAKANNVSSIPVAVTIATAAADSVTVSILPAEITVNGQAVVTAVVRDVDGNLLANKAVQFEIAAGSPVGVTIDATNGGITDVAGTASATITPGNAVGPVTATASVDGMSAEATIEIIAASSGSIAFVSAAPTLIGVTGSGLPETSLVTFEVQDETGALIADGTPVTFQLKASPLSDAALLDTLDLTSGGRASVVVTSGTVAGPVQVIAKVTLGGNQISTVSNNITVGSGPPADLHVSIARRPTNIAGRRTFGITSDVTAFGADRFSNFIPQGSAFAFVSESGGIEAQGLTATVDGIYLGSATVKLQSQEPLPADGLADVMTFINGEESFVDKNGNGRYDAGEDFFDVGEPFVDQNDNGKWDGDDPDTAPDESDTSHFGGVVHSGTRTFVGTANGAGVADFNSSCPPGGSSVPVSRRFFFDVLGDGVFDDGQDVDILTQISDKAAFVATGGEGNGFADLDGDCAWDNGEPFIDPWGNGPFGGDGRYLPGLDYTDINGNGRYDATEAFIEEVYFNNDSGVPGARDGAYDGPNGVWDDSILLFEHDWVIFSGVSRTFASPDYKFNLVDGKLPQDATTDVNIYVGDDVGQPIAPNGTAKITIAADGDGKVVGAKPYDVVDGMGTHFVVTVLNDTAADKGGLVAITVKLEGSDNRNIIETAVATIVLE